TYDIQEEINLSEVVPLIAKPSSPGNVVPVKEMEGTPIYQSYIGSSANPGFRDFAIAAQIVAGKQIAEGVSFDINPTSRQMLTDLVEEGHIADLYSRVRDSIKQVVTDVSVWGKHQQRGGIVYGQHHVIFLDVQERGKIVSSYVVRKPPQL